MINLDLFCNNLIKKCVWAEMTQIDMRRSLRLSDNNTQKPSQLCFGCLNGEALELPLDDPAAHTAKTGYWAERC